MPFGIGFEQSAGGIDRGFFADTGDDIEQRFAFGAMNERRGGCEGPRARGGRKCFQFAAAARILPVEARGKCKPNGARGVADLREQIAQFRIRSIAEDDGLQAFAMGEEIGGLQMAFAFGRAPVADGE